MLFRSGVVLIKCRFDQLSFRSNAVLIKCRFDRVSFQSSVVQSTVVAPILSLLQAAVLPGSDAGSDGVKQHQVLSSKTVRPLAPCGA